MYFSPYVPSKLVAAGAAHLLRSLGYQAFSICPGPPIFSSGPGQVSEESWWDLRSVRLRFQPSLAPGSSIFSSGLTSFKLPYTEEDSIYVLSHPLPNSSHLVP